MNKISTFLWFDNNAEQAVDFYASVFTDLKIKHTSRYGENPHMPAGTVMTVNFELFGQEFTALNGGPVYKFSEAISFVVNCEDQNEIDYFWDKLGENGTYQQCGWLTDQFGITWQIVPKNIGELLSPPDKEKAQRVMQELYKMIKLDIAKLKDA
jgi:predicted 3-demethylubiquinone-9 3-methyltransferase (glyoxalase superfamily)